MDTKTQEVTITVPKPPKGTTHEPGRVPKLEERFWWFNCREWIDSKQCLPPVNTILPLAFPAPKRKRLMTSAELAGKWLHRDGQSWLAWKFDSTFVQDYYSSAQKNPQKMHNEGTVYSLTPTSERLPLEIEDDQ